MKSYHDIAGDGGSDIVGQVRAARGRIAASLAGVRHLLAVASGKGGVGKSTLTRQLALALAARGWRVAILDADLNGPTQARLGGLEGATPVPGEKGLVLPRGGSGIGVVSLGAFVPESRAVEFASVARGDTFTWRATREFTTLGQLLAGVEWGELDALLLDLPPGAERTVQVAEFLGPDAAFVLVTLPSAMAQGVVARGAAALARTPNRVLGYILNMDGYRCPGCGEVRPLFPSPPSPTLDLPLLGSVPFDPRLAAACDRGEPLLEASEPAMGRPIAEIAARLVALLEES